MAEGLPKPRRSVYDTLKNRGEDLDEKISEAETGRKPEPRKPEPKGMPKPGMLDRLKKFIGLD